MRLMLGLALTFTAMGAVAAPDPRTLPTQLPPAWQAKTREVFKQSIEIPTVHHRGEMTRVANLLADQFRKAGIPDSDIHIMPYEALPGDKTAALIVRWRSPHATKKPMMILGHMDVSKPSARIGSSIPSCFAKKAAISTGGARAT
jgi:hypothetical protein